MNSNGPSLSLSFERYMRAKNLSPSTVASYLVGLRQFAAFLKPCGRDLTEATRADMEAFIADLLAHRSAAHRRHWLQAVTGVLSLAGR
jgi:site-specific recombinase XerD